MFFYLFFIIFFLSGLIVGSFLNVLIFRIYYKKPFICGRSYCPKCRKKISWQNNIPILSFLLLKGRCCNCQKKISWQYPLVEFFTGLLFVFVFLHNQDIVNMVGYFSFLIFLKIFLEIFVVCILIIIFVQDFNWYIILDRVILPAILVVFIFNIILGRSFFSLILGALLAGGFFYLQFIVSGGKWIGGGDLRLGLFMGVILGFPLVLVALFLAYIIGSLIGVFLILIKKKSINSQLPFGTFLVPATLIALFWGENILNWYMNMVL